MDNCSPTIANHRSLSCSKHWAPYPKIHPFPSSSNASLIAASPPNLLAEAAARRVVLADHVVASVLRLAELGPAREGVGGLVPAFAEMLRSDGLILSILREAVKGKDQLGKKTFFKLLV